MRRALFLGASRCSAPRWQQRENGPGKLPERRTQRCAGDDVGGVVHPHVDAAGGDDGRKGVVDGPRTAASQQSCGEEGGAGMPAREAARQGCAQRQRVRLGHIRSLRGERPA